MSIAAATSLRFTASFAAANFRTSLKSLSSVSPLWRSAHALTDAPYRSPVFVGMPFEILMNTATKK